MSLNAVSFRLPACQGSLAQLGQFCGTISDDRPAGLLVCVVTDSLLLRTYGVWRTSFEEGTVDMNVNAGKESNGSEWVFHGACYTSVLRLVLNYGSHRSEDTAAKGPPVENETVQMTPYPFPFLFSACYTCSVASETASRTGASFSDILMDGGVRSTRAEKRPHRCCWCAYL